MRRDLALAGLGASSTQPSIASGLWSWITGGPAPLLPASHSTSTAMSASPQAVQYTLNAGVDQGMVNALQIAGASDSQLALVANGALDPVQLLNELTGNSPAPGQSVMQASNVSQAIFGGVSAPQQQGFGPLSPGAVSDIVSVTDAGGQAAQSFSDWIAANWPWLALGGVGIWFVARELR